MAEALRLEEMERATTFKDQSPIPPVDRSPTLQIEVAVRPTQTRIQNPNTEITMEKETTSQEISNQTTEEETNPSPPLLATTIARGISGRCIFATITPR